MQSVADYIFLLKDILIKCLLLIKMRKIVNLKKKSLV